MNDKRYSNIISLMRWEQRYLFVRFLECIGWIYSLYYCPWWRHQMETFSALLAICAGNSPVPGEFPAQMPVMRSFNVFFDVRLNKRLSKQSRGWWFEALSCPLWRHCNAIWALVACCTASGLCFAGAVTFPVAFSQLQCSLQNNKALQSEARFAPKFALQWW